MWIGKTAPAPTWAQALAREMTRPAFARLPAGVRPYLLATVLFAAASAAMGAGHAALLRDGLPWALVSVLVVAAAAGLWGSRPALLVLALSALFTGPPSSPRGPGTGRRPALRAGARPPQPRARRLRGGHHRADGSGAAEDGRRPSAGGRSWRPCAP